MTDTPGSARHRRNRTRRGVVGPVVSAASVVLITAPVIWVMSDSRDAASLTTNDSGQESTRTSTRESQTSRDQSRAAVGPAVTMTVTTTGPDGHPTTALTTLTPSETPSTPTPREASPTVAPADPSKSAAAEPRTYRSRRDTRSTTAPPPAPTSSPTDGLTPTVPAGGADRSTGEQEAAILRYTNVIRKEAGCAPVSLDASLVESAGGHARDMVERQFFSHTNPDGESAYQRMQRAGFRGSAAGENIAAGYDTAERVMELWMKSDGHRANIVNCAYNRLGVGYHPGRVKRDFGPGSWVQNFGRS